MNLRPHSQGLVPTLLTTAPFLDATSATYGPAITTTNALTLDVIDASPALFAPTLIQDQFVTLDLLDAGSALYTPTLTVGVTITFATLDSGPALYAPDLIQDVFVTVPLLDAQNALYGPTITVGAVSITTNFRPASRMMRENAWNTAISSVHGDRRSSSSMARPCASSWAPFVSITWRRYRSVSTLGSMRLTVRHSSGPASVSARWAAGSDVVR